MIREQTEGQVILLSPQVQIVHDGYGFCHLEYRGEHVDDFDTAEDAEKWYKSSAFDDWLEQKWSRTWLNCL